MQPIRSIKPSGRCSLWLWSRSTSTTACGEPPFYQWPWLASLTATMRLWSMPLWKRSLAGCEWADKGHIYAKQGDNTCFYKPQVIPEIHTPHQLYSVDDAFLVCNSFVLCLSVSFARITKGIDATLFLEAFVRKPALFGLLHFIELFPDSARAQRRVLLMVRSFIHLLLFTSSHLHIFSSSHLLIFTSSHLHICTSSHLHISSSSHLGICTSSHLLCVSLSLSLARLLSISLFRRRRRPDDAGPLLSSVIAREVAGDRGRGSQTRPWQIPEETRGWWSDVSAFADLGGKTDAGMDGCHQDKKPVEPRAEAAMDLIRKMQLLWRVAPVLKINLLANIHLDGCDLWSLRLTHGCSRSLTRDCLLLRVIPNQLFINRCGHQQEDLVYIQQILISTKYWYLSTPGFFIHRIWNMLSTTWFGHWILSSSASMSAIRGVLDALRYPGALPRRKLPSLRGSFGRRDGWWRRVSDTYAVYIHYKHKG